jgi:translation initiation factor IF-2
MDQGETMRVFELAEKVNKTSKELLAELKKMGIKATNHMATLEKTQVRLVLDKFVKKPASPPPVRPAGPAVKRAGTVKPAKPPVRPSAVSTAPPPAEKKTRVLIKRKPVEPAVEQSTMAPAATVAEVAPSGPARVAVAPTKVEPTEPVAKPATPPAMPAEIHPEEAHPVITPSPAAHPPLPKEAKPVAEIQPGTEMPPPAPVAPAAVSDQVAEKKLEKRRLLKTDLFELAKQEMSNRLKERFKKGRKSKRLKDEPWTDFQTDLSGWSDASRSDASGFRKSPRPVSPTGVAEITKPRKKVIKLSEGLTVKDFSELIGQKATEVIKKLMEMGSMATVNQPIDLEAAVLIADGYGLKAEVVLEQTEEQMLAEEEETPAALKPRPPVVTIMGHVDHGKTSLLDAIRETKVAAGEAGGITQHIGAYSVKVGDRTVVFLDTPGHEAFTAMRARGAKVTDIVVLVVAADDGVMPQTVEAINHARAANVPILVALNKIDKPEANPERVKHALSEHGLIPEAWGGQTIFVEVSAKKRINLNALLEMILLQADVLELTADSDRPAKGVIIEAKMDKGRGPVATVLVQNGTLRAGDAFVVGLFDGRVRALIDDVGKKVMEAGPSMPVEVIGLPGVPQAGDPFQVVRDERLAREIAMTRQLKQRTRDIGIMMKGTRPISLEDLYAKIKEGTVKELNLILRADVQGSAEALRESIEKLSTPAVKLKVINQGVGAITETDVLLASASNASIIGFNVRPESKALAAAEQEGVDIRSYTVIYDAINDIKAAMEGLLEPTFKERVIGRCEVRQTFTVSKVGTVAGAYVTEGMISRAGSGARVIRDGTVVYEGKIGSLKRFKDDVREVQTGYECGVGIENFNDIKVGDIIEVYTMDKIAGKL